MLHLFSILVVDGGVVAVETGKGSVRTIFLLVSPLAVSTFLSGSDLFLHWTFFCLHISATASGKIFVMSSTVFSAEY